MTERHDAPHPSGGVPPEDRPPAMPRWVKLSATVLGVLVLVVLVALLAGGHDPGAHGPGRHGG